MSKGHKGTMTRVKIPKGSGPATLPNTAWQMTKAKAIHEREVRVSTLRHREKRKGVVEGVTVGVSIRLPFSAEPRKLRGGDVVNAWLKRKQLRKLRDALTRALGER